MSLWGRQGKFASRSSRRLTGVGRTSEFGQEPLLAATGKNCSDTVSRAVDGERVRVTEDSEEWPDYGKPMVVH